MQTRNAARVLPLPVGAEMRVASPARMLGQPWVCGSVGLPNFCRNHSAVTGWAQASEWGFRDAFGGMGHADSNRGFIRSLFACAVDYMLPAPTSEAAAALLDSSRYCSITFSRVPWAVRMKSMASRPAPKPPGLGVT